MLKVGILTSGGDCQSLNATMRGVAKALYNEVKNVEILGIEEGYKGLIYGKCHKMNPRSFSGILTKGGTILGTSRQPFKEIMIPDENGLDKVKAMKETYKKLHLDCLVVLGGNGSHKTANLLAAEGMNIITLPKTIDNDIWGTDITFGFQSAVDIAANVIDNIHTTASSHQRVFIVEVMGHKTGWLTLHAGIAGGADVILLPEIPYDIDSVCKAVKNREKQGKKFSIIAVAEGAIAREEACLTKKEYKEKVKNREFPSVSYEIGRRIEEKTGLEIRVVIPGHIQRGGAPCPYDRVLSSRLGASAAQRIMKKEYGCMVGMNNNEIVYVSLEDVAGKLKRVNPDCTLIHEAKLMGISFGD